MRGREGGAGGVGELEGVAGAEEDGDAVDVHGGADAVGDGVDEGSDFGEVAGFVGELGEELLGGVGVAEEALIDFLLEPFGEDEAEGEEEAEDAEDADEIDVALMARVAEVVQQGPDKPKCKQDADDGDGLASEEVSGALADEDADIHCALDDDDVCEGDGEEGEHAQGGGKEPLGDAFADVAATEESVEEQKRDGGDGDGGADVEDAEAAFGVGIGGDAHLVGDGGEEDADGDEGKAGFKGGDEAHEGQHPADGAEAEDEANGEEEVQREEDEDGADEEPLEPGIADVEGGSAREVDAEEHDAEGAGGVGDVAPKRGDVKPEAGPVESGVDGGGEVSEDAEEEPGVGVVGFGEDDPAAEGDAEDGKEEAEEDVLGDDVEDAEGVPVVSGDKADEGGAGGAVRCEVGEGHDVAGMGAFDLFDEDLCAGEGDSVDGEDGGEAIDSGSGGFGRDVRSAIELDAEADGLACDVGAVEDQLPHDGGTVDGVGHREGHDDGQKDVLEAR